MVWKDKYQIDKSEERGKCKRDLIFLCIFNEGKVIVYYVYN